jgi:hypothetical protein
MLFIQQVLFCDYWPNMKLVLLATFDLFMCMCLSNFLLLRLLCICVCKNCKYTYKLKLCLFVFVSRVYIVFWSDYLAHSSKIIQTSLTKLSEQQ